MLKEPVQCGNPDILKMLNVTTRAVSKDWIQSIKRDGKSFCGWCNKNELPIGRKKYCSDDCATTSSAFCSPQTSVFAFQYLMTRQDNKCAHCNHDYSEAMNACHLESMKWDKDAIKHSIKTLKNISQRIKDQVARMPTYVPLPAYYVFHPDGSVTCVPATEHPTEAIKGYKKWFKSEMERVRENLTRYEGSKEEGFQWRYNSPD